jgi:hypothetical protein
LFGYLLARTLVFLVCSVLHFAVNGVRGCVVRGCVVRACVSAFVRSFVSSQKIVRSFQLNKIRY